MKEYTYEEISKHNSINDSWIIINGNVYDITKFVKEHSGGNMPCLFSGTDASNIFDANHPPHVKKILNSYEFKKKYYKGKVKEYEPLNIKTCPNMTKCREEIWDKLKSKGINSKNKKNNKIVFVNYLLIILYCFTYLKLLKTNSYKYAIVFGIITAIFLASSHEIAHYSTNKYLPFYEKILIVLVPNVAGLSNNFWISDHIKNHHQYPNLKDDDWQPLLRLNNYSKCLCTNRYQILILFFIMFPFSMIGIFISDIYHNYKLLKKTTCLNKLMWILGKIIWIYLILIKPIKKYGTEWIPNLVIISVIVGIGGWIFNFLNHHFEEIPFYDPIDCWKKEVIEKSINWESFGIINFLSFGLNNHVEHHLFPTVSSCNLKYITPILKKYCKIKKKKLNVAIKDHLKNIYVKGNCT